MFTLHCKPLYTPTDIDPTPRLSTLARLRRHAHQTCLIIKSIPWGKSDRATKAMSVRSAGSISPKAREHSHCAARLSSPTSNGAVTASDISSGDL